MFIHTTEKEGKRGPDMQQACARCIQRCARLRAKSLSTASTFVCHSPSCRNGASVVRVSCSVKLMEDWAVIVRQDA